MLANSLTGTGDGTGFLPDDEPAEVVVATSAHLEAGTVTVYIALRLDATGYDAAAPHPAVSLLSWASRVTATDVAGGETDIPSITLRWVQ